MRLSRFLRQAPWYAMQTGIVALVLYVDHLHGGHRTGLALLLGVGWALAATVVIHLILNGIRRLRGGNVPPPLVEDRDAIAISPDRRSIFPLKFLGPVPWRDRRER